MSPKISKERVQINIGLENKFKLIEEEVRHTPLNEPSEFDTFMLFNYSNPDFTFLESNPIFKDI